MKKIMLYISLAMSILYAVAVGGVVAAQDMFKDIYGLRLEESVFIVPTEELMIHAVFVMITIVFALLLMKSIKQSGTHIEVIVLIVFVILLVGAPFITNIGTVLQNMHYAAEGTEVLASYSVVNTAIGSCRPILNFAQLLLIVFAGISLGRKERT